MSQNVFSDDEIFNYLLHKVRRCLHDHRYHHFALCRKKQAVQSVTRFARILKVLACHSLFTLMKLSCAQLIPKYRSDRVPHCGWSIATGNSLKESTPIIVECATMRDVYKSKRPCRHQRNCVYSDFLFCEIKIALNKAFHFQ